MSTYEQLVINGVPFLHSNGKLYYYELTPSEPVEIGTLVNGALQLSAGWAERIQPRVDAWRGTVAPSERGKTVRAPKQSKPKRSPKSAAKTAGKDGTTADTTNTVVSPEPAPTRVIKRRKTVPANAP